MVTPSAATNAALQTQLDATGWRPEIFKCLGHPWGARRAMYFLTHNELLVCAATCLILKEWSAHYVWEWTYDRDRTEMPQLGGTDGERRTYFDVPTMTGRISETPLSQWPDREPGNEQPAESEADDLETRV